MHRFLLLLCLLFELCFFRLPHQIQNSKASTTKYNSYIMNYRQQLRISDTHIKDNFLKCHSLYNIFEIKSFGLNIQIKYKHKSAFIQLILYNDKFTSRILLLFKL